MVISTEQRPFGVTVPQQGDRCLMAINKHPGVQQVLHDKEKLRTSKQETGPRDGGYNKIYL